MARAVVRLQVLAGPRRPVARNHSALGEPLEVLCEKRGELLDFSIRDVFSRELTRSHESMSLILAVMPSPLDANRYIWTLAKLQGLGLG